MILSDGNREERKIGVLICDDHELIRQALRTVVDDERDMQVVGEAADGEQAIAMARTLQPDAIVMDIQMPIVSGIEATRRIKTSLPNTSILVLTAYDCKEYILRILEVGASGYLSKGVISKEIPNAIRSAVNGDYILSQDILQKIIGYAMQFSSGIQRKSPQEALTNREREILALAANGDSNKTIAKHLNLTENTVKKRMMMIFDKLGVRSRTAAVIAAQEVGLLSSRQP